MTKPQIASRVSEDLDEALDEFADEKGISKAESIRRLLESGLKHEEQQPRFEQLEEQLMADGGVASKSELTRLRDQLKTQQRAQNRQQQAEMWQNLGLGSGILYLAGLTFFDVRISVVLIFGAIISLVILYSVYRLSEFIDINEKSDTETHGDA